MGSSTRAKMKAFVNSSSGGGGNGSGSKAIPPSVLEELNALKQKVSLLETENAALQAAAAAPPPPVEASPRRTPAPTDSPSVRDVLAMAADGDRSRCGDSVSFEGREASQSGRSQEESEGESEPVSQSPLYSGPAVPPPGPQMAHSSMMDNIATARCRRRSMTFSPNCGGLSNFLENVTTHNMAVSGDASVTNNYPHASNHSVTNVPAASPTCPIATETMANDDGGNTGNETAEEGIASRFDNQSVSGNRSRLHSQDSVSVQLTPPSNFMVSPEEKNRLPSSRRDERYSALGFNIFGGGRSNGRSDTAVASAMKAYKRTVNALACEDAANGEAFSVPQQLAFQQFMLLSLKGTLPGDEYVDSNPKIHQLGASFLDPFRVSVADVIDRFPKSESEDDGSSGGRRSRLIDDSASFDPAALAPFCMPNGVKARLVPKMALNNVERMGWAGKKLDKCSVLVFTDGSGVASHGVSITILEEDDSPTLVKYLANERKRRRAAVIIGQCWKQFKKRMLAAGHGVFGGLRLSRQTSPRQSTSTNADTVSYASGMANGSVGESTHHTKHSMRWLRRETSNGQSRNRGVSLRKWMSNSTKSGSSCSDGSTGSPTRATTAQGRIAEILEEFMKTSPVSKYDYGTHTGVWESAKLRLASGTNECTVVVKHAPLKDVTKEAAAKYFNAERIRLTQMLNYEPIPLPSKAPIPGTEEKKFVRFKAVKFKQCNNLSPAVHPSLALLGNINPNTHFSGWDVPGTNQKGVEAYRHMRESERLGDVCIVEKCYVLMGGKERQHSLLLSALKKMVDAERKVHKYDSNGMCQSVSDALVALTGPCGVRNGSTIVSGGIDIKYQRDSILTVMQSMAKLSQEQEDKEAALILSGYHVQQHLGQAEENKKDEKTVFEFDIPDRKSSTVRTPLPLPQIAGEYGLRNLLLRFEVDEMMKILKLLLLERSLLVVGDNAEDVTSCASTLLELLKPFEWSNTFLPLLPASMLDFINSPIPFVVGVEVEGEEGMEEILNDHRVLAALEDGVNVLNLTSNKLELTLGCGEDQMVSVPMALSTRLQSLQFLLREKTQGKNAKTAAPMQQFVENGLKPEEAELVHAVQFNILNYVKSLGEDFAAEKSLYNKFSKTPGKLTDFNFYRSMYVNRLTAEMEFRKEMAHTQMFAWFFDAARQGGMDAFGNSIPACIKDGQQVAKDQAQAA